VLIQAITVQKQGKIVQLAGIRPLKNPPGLTVRVLYFDMLNEAEIIMKLLQTRDHKDENVPVSCSLKGFTLKQHTYSIGHTFLPFVAH
jgi:hypothetical protein